MLKLHNRRTHAQHVSSNIYSQICAVIIKPGDSRIENADVMINFFFFSGKGIDQSTWQYF